MNKVECEIMGISANPATGGAFALLLKEVDGNRRLPIIIGQPEANAIAIQIEGYKPPRPLTHDLLKNVIDNLGATVVEVVITELRDNTFYAKVLVDVSSLTNEIDARPSDAIALALRANAPIFVSDLVLEIAGFTPSKEADPFVDENLLEEKEEKEQKDPEGFKTKESKIAKLQNLLREALENEDYERAANLRDEIKKLTDIN